MTTIQKSQRNYKVLALIMVLIGLIIGVSSFIYMINKDYDLNEIGDFLSGTIGAFWGIAGLILVYVAFLGQKEQLLNQEEELRLSREEQKLIRLEMEAQRKQMTTQSENSKIERFENTFFKLLNHHDHSTEYFLLTIYGTYVGGGIATQKEVINESIKQGKKAFPRLMNKFFGSKPNSKNSSAIELAEETYKNVVKRFKDDMQLGEELIIYSRSFFSLFMFIEQSDVSDKQLYSEIIITHLPTSEKIVLLYLCAISNEREFYSSLANKYSMFKDVLDYLKENSESFIWGLLNLFEPSAFGVSEEYFQLLKEEKDVANIG